MRIDKYLKNYGYCESRNKVASLIESGAVSVNGVIINKSSYDVKEGASIEIFYHEKQYVSRSAKKLLTAIQAFGLDFTNKIAVDLGASTGGFCEVMLEHGVKHVYAVDVGSNQLHKTLSDNPSITNIENTNARYITKEIFSNHIDIITCDLSFISLNLILEPVYSVLDDGGEFVCLVKPQFEAGTKYVNKNGVVKSVKARAEVVKNIVEHARKIGFDVLNVCFSGIEGENGNREYLLYMKKCNEFIGITPIMAERYVIEDDK